MILIKNNDNDNNRNDNSDNSDNNDRQKTTKKMMAIGIIMENCCNELQQTKEL